MEKVYFTGGIQTVNDPVWNVLRLLQDKENEIIDWIKEHEKYVQPLEKAWKEAVEQTLEQAKEKKGEDKPKVLRYELSNDKAGLVAYLAGGISYHIHWKELSLDQQLIRNQLIDMEER